MRELSIEMKEYAFQVAVQAASKRAVESISDPKETAILIANAALSAALTLGLSTSQDSQPAQRVTRRDDQ